MVDRPPPEPREPGRAAQAAVMLAQGASVRSTAAKVGVSERTVHRWRTNPKFRARVEELRTEMTDQVVGGLVSASRAAVAELHRLMTQSGNDTVRLGAARCILDKLLLLHEHFELSERVKALEARSDSGPWEGR